MEKTIVINSTIQEQIYQVIRHEVVNRVYREGEQLKEADLAERFNISRSPVREALHRLAGDGLLTIIPNRGVFVKEMDEKYITDILDLRAVLECRGIELYAGQCKEKLREIRERMNSLAEKADPDKCAEAEEFLHKLLIKQNNNVFISEADERISALSAMFMKIAYSNSDSAVRGLRRHIETIDAMLADDIPAAAAAHRAYIEGVKAVVKAQLMKDIQQ